MHVAFPSSEIFRCLSQREQLLRGMLGADLISFQTANYARHFRQTVSRILAVEALPRGIQLESDYDIQSPVTSPSVLLSPRQESRKQLGSSASLGQLGGEGTGEGDGLEGQIGKGRFVDVGVFPMGIDVGQLKMKG
jgi:trehalose 6-phosphate synthase complex regulatory subunit